MVMAENYLGEARQDFVQANGLASLLTIIVDIITDVRYEHIKCLSTGILFSI